LPPVLREQNEHNKTIITLVENQKLGQNRS